MKRALSLLLTLCASVTLALDVRVPGGITEQQVASIVSTSTVTRALHSDALGTDLYGIVPVPNEAGDGLASLTLLGRASSDWPITSSSSLRLVPFEGFGEDVELTQTSIGEGTVQGLDMFGLCGLFMNADGRMFLRTDALADVRWLVTSDTAASAAVSGYPAPLAVTTDTTTNVIQWGYATNHFEIVHTNGTLFLTNLWLAGATHVQHSYLYLHNSNSQPWSVQGVSQWCSDGNFTASMPPTAVYNELMFQRDVRGIVKGYVVVTNGVSP